MADNSAAELRAIATYIRGAQARVQSNVKPVVAKAAVNVKTMQRTLLAGTKSNVRLIRAVSYDLTNGGFGAEIGPDQAISGLGLGREFGSSNTGPRPFVLPSADVEEPKFLEAVEKAFGDAWENLP